MLKATRAPVLAAFVVAVLIVLGIDIDARAWMWTVAARVVLPMGFLLLLLIGAVVAFFSTRRADASPKPVLRRLCPPWRS